MQKKLETPEDFKKALERLSDPNRSLFDAPVQDFGYCPNCSDVTTYSPDLYGVDSYGAFSYKCHNCKKNFYDDITISSYGALSSKNKGYVPSRRMELLPGHVQAKIKTMLSHNNQLQVLIQRLQEKIDTLTSIIVRNQEQNEKLNKEKEELLQFLRQAAKK